MHISGAGKAMLSKIEPSLAQDPVVTESSSGSNGNGTSNGNGRHLTAGDTSSTPAPVSTPVPTPSPSPTPTPTPAPVRDTLNPDMPIPEGILPGDDPGADNHSTAAPTSTATHSNTIPEPEGSTEGDPVVNPPLDVTTNNDRPLAESDRLLIEEVDSHTWQSMVATMPNVTFGADTVHPYSSSHAFEMAILEDLMDVGVEETDDATDSEVESADTVEATDATDATAVSSSGGSSTVSSSYTVSESGYINSIYSVEIPESLEVTESQLWFTGADSDVASFSLLTPEMTHYSTINIYPDATVTTSFPVFSPSLTGGIQVQFSTPIDPATLADYNPLPVYEAPPPPPATVGLPPPKKDYSQKDPSFLEEWDPFFDAYPDPDGEPLEIQQMRQLNEDGIGGDGVSVINLELPPGNPDHAGYILSMHKDLLPEAQLLIGSYFAGPGGAEYEWDLQYAPFNFELDLDSETPFTEQFGEYLSGYLAMDGRIQVLEAIEHDMAYLDGENVIISYSMGLRDPAVLRNTVVNLGLIDNDHPDFTGIERINADNLALFQEIFGADAFNITDGMTPAEIEQAIGEGLRAMSVDQQDAALAAYGDAVLQSDSLGDTMKEYINTVGNLPDNVLVVASSGNEGPYADPIKDQISHLPNFMSVGAADQFVDPDTEEVVETIANFSSYNPNNPDYVDVTAAGVDVYGQMEGTSFAQPLVTNVAAMIWEVYPELSAEAVAEIIKHTAYDNPDIDNAQEGAGRIRPSDAIRWTNTLKLLGGIFPAFVQDLLQQPEPKEPASVNNQH